MRNSRTSGKLAGLYPYTSRENTDKSKIIRPIALLSPNAKLTETILLSEFEEHPLKEHQHGFRHEQYTKTALNIVTNNIQKSLNQKKPCNGTLLVALDLTAAFDMVDCNLLLLFFFAQLQLSVFMAFAMNEMVLKCVLTIRHIGLHFFCLFCFSSSIVLVNFSCA